ncbi:MAG: hypothetical protein AAFR81_19630 [Chloroflexota bacterium]
MFKRKKKSPVEKAREDLEKQIRVVNKQAESTRKEMVKRLNSTAEELRSGLSHLLEREDRTQVQKVAQELENIAKNVEKEAEKRVKGITKKQEKNGFGWLTLGVAVLVGIVVGLLLEEILD